MFSVSYDIITPESAEQGDAESRGYVLPGDWRADIVEALANPALVGMSLREAMQLACPQESAGGWWSEIDGRQDYQTGAYEFRSIHPPRNITPSSFARVSRLLGIRA